MPGSFPLGLELCNPQDFGSVGSFGTTLTASATPNTKGSWTQITGSPATYDVAFVVINPVYYNITKGNLAFDVGIGPNSGAVQTLVPNIICSSGTGIINQTAPTIAIPLQIPAGSTFWGRCQSTIANDAGINLNMYCYDGAFTQIEGYAGVDALGFNAGTTTGTEVALAAFTSEYATVVASTTRDYAGFFVAFDVANTSTYVGDFSFALLLGSSSSTNLLLPNVVRTAWPAGTVPNPVQFIPVPIPAGSQITAATYAVGGPDNIDVTVYGVYQ